uniref:Uncharacterized protein n=1 Tax=Ditylenchus dipsaci TaxID=166011 RepID=A0A915CYC2_9BILA
MRSSARILSCVEESSATTKDVRQCKCNHVVPLLVKETEIVSGKPPSPPSSFKKFWRWSSSPAADGSSKN